MKNLIYTTIGYDIKYIKIIKLLLDSLVKYSQITFDFCIICDNNMYNEINLLCDQFINTLNICIYCLDFNSNKPDIASINKLRIFEWNKIDIYDKVLFIDGDILVNYDINKIFDIDILDNILYVYKEYDIIEYHKEKWWSLQNYTNEDLETFRVNKIYPFNCGIFLFNNTIEMKTDFMSILHKISVYTGDYFYEQSFMNEYFNKKMNVNYTVFTKDNYKMFPDLYTKYNSIIHFCGAYDTNKYDKMLYYTNKYL